MRRGLFNLAAAVSLVVLVAVGLLWARSYVRIDRVQWHSYVSDDGSTLVRRYWLASSGNGGLWLDVNTHTMTQPAYAANAAGIRALYPAGKQPQWTSSRLMNELDVNSFHRFVGFVHSETRYSNSIARVREQLWRAPYWAIALMTALLPWRWLKLSKRWRLIYRRQNRLCPACGYDLRATPERCPECGAVRDLGAEAAA